MNTAAVKMDAIYRFQRHFYDLNSEALPARPRYPYSRASGTIVGQSFGNRLRDWAKPSLHRQALSNGSVLWN